MWVREAVFIKMLKQYLDIFNVLIFAIVGAKQWWAKLAPLSQNPAVWWNCSSGHLILHYHTVSGRRKAISFKNVLQEAVKYSVVLHFNTWLHIFSIFSVTKLKLHTKHFCCSYNNYLEEEAGVAYLSCELN